MVQNIMTDIRYYTELILEDWEIKAVLSSLLVFIVDYTGISIALYITLCLTIFFDMFFGVWAALHTNSFEFCRLKQWIRKVFIYGFSICLFSMADFLLTQGTYHVLAQLVVSLIGITEIVSILGHCVTLEFPVPNSIMKLAKSAQKKIENKIDGLVDEKREER